MIKKIWDFESREGPSLWWPEPFSCDGVGDRDVLHLGMTWCVGSYGNHLEESVDWPSELGWTIAFQQEHPGPFDLQLTLFTAVLSFVLEFECELSCKKKWVSRCLGSTSGHETGALATQSTSHCVR